MGGFGRLQLLRIWIMDALLKWLAETSSNGWLTSSVLAVVTSILIPIILWVERYRRNRPVRKRVVQQLIFEINNICKLADQIPAELSSSLVHAQGSRRRDDFNRVIPFFGDQKRSACEYLIDDALNRAYMRYQKSQIGICCFTAAAASAADEDLTKFIQSVSGLMEQFYYWQIRILLKLKSAFEPTIQQPKNPISRLDVELIRSNINFVLRMSINYSVDAVAFVEIAGGGKFIFERSEGEYYDEVSSGIDKLFTELRLRHLKS